MSTRLIWISLAVVAAVLVGASALANPTAWQSVWAPIAAYPWKDLWAPIVAYPWQAWYDANLLRTQTLAGQYPGWAAAAATTVTLLLAALLVRRIRRPRAPKLEMVPFSDALEHAMAEPAEAGTGGRHEVMARPRKRQVAELALAGHPVAEIARTTRLSQDAVRALLARRAGATTRPA